MDFTISGSELLKDISNKWTNRRLEYRLLTADDVDELAKLFAKCFCEREPTTVHLNFNEDEFYTKLSYPFASMCAKEELSFICEDQSLEKGDRIVGFLLGTTMSVRHDAEYDQEEDVVPTMLLEFEIAWLKTHPELYAVEWENKISHFEAIAIRNGYEQMGIACKLVEFYMNNLKSKGYRLVYVCATAEATQHIFSKYGFKLVNKLMYKDFVYKGVKVFESLVKPPMALNFEYYLKDWNYSENKVKNVK